MQDVRNRISVARERASQERLLLSSDLSRARSAVSAIDLLQGKTVPSRVAPTGVLQTAREQVDDNTKGRAEREAEVVAAARAAAYKRAHAELRFADAAATLAQDTRSLAQRVDATHGEEEEEFVERETGRLLPAALAEWAQLERRMSRAQARIQDAHRTIARNPRAVRRPPLATSASEAAAEAARHVRRAEAEAADVVAGVVTNAADEAAREAHARAATFAQEGVPNSRQRPSGAHDPRDRFSLRRPGSRKFYVEGGAD